MRLFTGIAVSQDVRDSLAHVLRDLHPLAPLNWSRVENLHITSKFIGEWPEGRLTELEEALEKLDPPGRFEVTIARFGYFPNPHNPRTLFAGIQAGPALAALAHVIDEALAPVGVAHENRPYAPHLTLAPIKKENIRELREHIAKMTNFDFGTFQVSEFHLYQSNRLRLPEVQGTVVYTPLATYPLLTTASIQTGESIQA